MVPLYYHGLQANPATYWERITNRWMLTVVKYDVFGRWDEMLAELMGR